MVARLRKLLVPVVVATMAAAGISYAATSDDAPRTAAEETSFDGVEFADPDSALDFPELEISDVTPIVDPTDTVDTDVTPTVGTDRSSEGCPEGFSGNHGQFVSGTEERPRRDAAHSDCGKPLHAVDHEEETEGEDDGEESGDDAPEGHENGHGHGNGQKRGHDKGHGGEDG